MDISDVISSLKVRVDAAGRKTVHTFLHARSFSGADMDLDEAEAVVQTGLPVEVPRRYLACKHSLGRVDPRNGQILYFETQTAVYDSAASR